MSSVLDPALAKDLSEAKAAVARHGIVIMRTVETEFEPAVMAEAKDSMASSPKKLAQMRDDELDEFAESLRKAAMRSAKELGRLYTRLLGKLGTEYIGELVKDLEGIGQLFTWERIREGVGPVNELLEAKGFRAVDMPGPEALSENLRIELVERWPKAFERFTALAGRAAEELEKAKAEEKEAQAPRKRTKRSG